VTHRAAASMADTADTITAATSQAA
jgi:hypothetical protein